MKRKLIALLAVGLLSRFAAPVTAQVADVGGGATAAKTGFMIDAANSGGWADAQVIWSAFAWCHSGLGLEVAVRQGEIASAIGMPVSSGQDGNVAAPVCDDESDNAFSCCSFTEAPQSANDVTGVGPLLAHCQNAEYPMGSVVGLPTAYLDPMGIGGYAPPPGAIVWTEEKASPLHFNVGGCFVAGFWSTGLHGPQSMRDFMGTGCCVSMGYTLPSGMEIQVFVDGFVARQSNTR